MSDFEQIDIHVFGSGCLSYPWWTSITSSEQDVWIVGWSDPDGDGSGGVKQISPDALFDAAMDNLRAGYGNEYARAGMALFYAAQFAPTIWDSLDIDADVADLLLQRAVMGDVIYG